MPSCRTGSGGERRSLEQAGTGKSPPDLLSDVRPAGNRSEQVTADGTIGAHTRWYSSPLLSSPCALGSRTRSYRTVQLCRYFIVRSVVPRWLPRERTAERAVLRKPPTLVRLRPTARVSDASYRSATTDTLPCATTVFTVSRHARPDWVRCSRLERSPQGPAALLRSRTQAWLSASCPAPS